MPAINRHKITNYCISKLDWLMSFIIQRFIMEKEISEIMKISKVPYFKRPMEDEWVMKWKQLSSYVNKKYYRTFSYYIGNNVNIVPDDICHNVIEPILNPKRFLSAYEDKCLFDKMLWSSFNRNITPITYIKNIGGANFDINYTPIKSIDVAINEIPLEIDRLIIKKSIDSSSGKDVVFVQRDINGCFKDCSTGEAFSEQYLIKTFNQNYVVQKAMSQSSFMSQFCKTSVNTIRIAVYRSVRTNIPSVINAIIRIGKDGSLVDNAHAGGMFVGVDNDGVLGKYCCNQYGKTVPIFNGIDFSSTTYQIPNYESVKEFAEKVASALPHQRLLALDVMLDKDDNPVLLEYNIRAFSVWLFQFTNGAGFGEFTDEIIEYCKEHRKEATRVSVTF